MPRAKKSNPQFIKVRWKNSTSEVILAVDQISSVRGTKDISSSQIFMKDGSHVTAAITVDKIIELIEKFSDVHDAT